MTFRIEDFGVELTTLASRGVLDPVYGRDAELARLLRVLVRRTKNNPVLLGEPGVGKTAIVEALAQKIAIGSVPPALSGVSVFSLNLGSLLAGTGYRGDFEQRLQQLVTELRRPGARRLLFIDELHLLGRAGRSEGGLDAANLLKPLLARGELPCIGASTPEEWKTMVAADPALERRFQPIDVPEPNAAETLNILRALRHRFETHHRVRIADEALSAAIERSSGTGSRRFPDKAIDLLDEACALLRLAHAEPASVEFCTLQQRLANAERRFDLNEVALITHRLLPGLMAQHRPVLDASGIEALGLSGQ